MLYFRKKALQKLQIKAPELAEYEEFLQSVRRFLALNDTYHNVARLQKSRFFVLHHELYGDVDALLPYARLEQHLGWKSNYFVPAEMALCKQPVLKKFIALGHDVGLLYDCLNHLAQTNDLEDKDIYPRAWAAFGENLRQNHALNIRSIAPYPRPNGKDNSLLWQRYDYRVQNIRCDTEQDFRDDNIIYFCLQNGEIQYLKRDLYGRYHPQKTRKKIRSCADLGQRLQKGLLVPRMVVKIRWE